jgi:hypothetical protein
VGAADVVSARVLTLADTPIAKTIGNAKRKFNFLTIIVSSSTNLKK